MQMFFAYGIFDDEADDIIALVQQHAPLEQLHATPCPACDSKMDVSFNKDGSGFSLHCNGEPLHMTKHQEIENPPPWWRECFEEPTDTTWYWREWHSYDDGGTLHMKISGWRADDVRWSGTLECPTDHPDYELWKWIFTESGFAKDLITDTDLDELRVTYEDRK